MNEELTPKRSKISNEKFATIVIVALALLYGVTKLISNGRYAALEKRAYVAHFYTSGANQKASGANETFVAINKEHLGTCVHVVHTPKGYFIMPGRTLSEAMYKSNLDFKGPYNDEIDAIDAALKSGEYFMNAHLYYKVINGNIYDKETGENWGNYFRGNASSPEKQEEVRVENPPQASYTTPIVEPTKPRVLNDFSAQKEQAARIEASSNPTREETITSMPTKFAYHSVVNDRAYFYSKPSLGTKRKAYLTKGDRIQIEKVEGEFGYGKFDNNNGIITAGWLLLVDLAIDD